MVVISWPAASDTRFTQERMASPLRWTVQAPQSAMPQPYLVPVRPSVSRNTHSSGVLGSTSALNCLPLTLRVITTRVPSVRQYGRIYFSLIVKLESETVNSGKGGRSPRHRDH